MSVYDEDRFQMVQAAAIADLSGAFGTANGAMEDVTASPTQSAVNNNFQECQTKINAILAVLRTAGILAQDYEEYPMVNHPDEVVQPEDEVPSELISEAKARHEFAKTEYATPQEKKQAEVEQAHALSTRPDGSYAQLHEGETPTLAVADEAKVKELKEDQDKAIAALEGDVPAESVDKSRSGDNANPTPPADSTAKAPAKATPAKADTSK